MRPGLLLTRMVDQQTDVVVVGGGQAGLAAAHHLTRAKLRHVVVEAGLAPVGAWPGYYDSLTLFSPARYSALPGHAFPGDPDRYPRRDEVSAYLHGYAKALGSDIRTGQRVVRLEADRDGFLTTATGADRWHSRAVIAATGTFGAPDIPAVAGLDGFVGTWLHSAAYRRPAQLSGRRIVVVGAGNSAVQIGSELAAVARVTLAARRPPRVVPQRPLGADLHAWLHASRADRIPLRLLPWRPDEPVLDPGRYRRALRTGRPDVRPMFRLLDGDAVVWADGTREPVDTVLFATGYRPDLAWLAPLGALDDRGRPRHREGLSTTHPGLAYVGVPSQRTWSSGTLRGVGPDAAHVVRALTSVIAQPRKDRRRGPVPFHPPGKEVNHGPVLPSR